MNGNEAKTAQLGVPFGTASGRLRKILLYDMAKRLNEDTCYRCKLKIINIDDFSIDHKINWLHSGRAVELFFNINNIVFSHVLCNNLAARKIGRPGQSPGNKRQPIPDGMAWCGKEQGYKPVSRFSSNKHRWNRLQDICIDCRSSYRSPRKVPEVG